MSAWVYSQIVTRPRTDAWVLFFAWSICLWEVYR